MKIERRTRNARVEGQSPTKTPQPPSLRAMKRKWHPWGTPRFRVLAGRKRRFLAIVSTAVAQHPVAGRSEGDVSQT